MKENGYVVQEYKVPVKRYCQTMDLKDNPELIAEYVKRHSEAEAWPEIRAGIREVGILEMEIYILGTRLAPLPRQAEWEAYMSIFQQADATATSAEKWQLMDRMFYLYK